MPISDNEREHYHRLIDLGKEIRGLFGEPIGQYLMRKAQEQVDAVIDAFQDADPTDVRVITRLQVELRSALSVPQWLSQALNEGQDAELEYSELREMEREEKGG